MKAFSTDYENSIMSYAVKPSLAIAKVRRDQVIQL